MEDTDKQGNNKVDAIRPYMWKKGQSGNILGRPKGKTMKEYAQEYLSKMSDEERDAWLEGLDKEIVWKMGEGNPKQDTDIRTPDGIKVVFDPIFKKDASTPEPKEHSSL